MTQQLSRGVSSLLCMQSDQPTVAGESVAESLRFTLTNTDTDTRLGHGVVFPSGRVIIEWGDDNTMTIRNTPDAFDNLIESYQTHPGKTMTMQDDPSVDSDVPPRV